MLVLSRRVGESMVIGNDVIVTIHKIRGKQVQIGIKAPNDVRVLRQEIKFWADDPDGSTHPAEMPFRSND
ncbi:MAG: carbon storage regulator [Mariniblastus sp.]|jgi:carbon storage regulator